MLAHPHRGRLCSWHFASFLNVLPAAPVLAYAESGGRSASPRSPGERATMIINETALQFAITVAGTFYPAHVDQLRAAFEDLTVDHPADEPLESDPVEGGSGAGLDQLPA